jgi:hypothetical protein
MSIFKIILPGLIPNYMYTPGEEHERSLDFFYIHLYCRKYKNIFQKFGGTKHKTTFFYLELLLVYREDSASREQRRRSQRQGTGAAEGAV